MVKVSCTASPVCCAARSLIATRTAGAGGVGSPGAPQPPASKSTKNKKQNWKRGRRVDLGFVLRMITGLESPRFAWRISCFHFSNFGFLQNVTAQVLVLHDFCELLLHVGGIYFDVFLLQVLLFHASLVQNFFENGVQEPRAGVLGLLIAAGCKLGEAVDGGAGEF